MRPTMPLRSPAAERLVSVVRRFAGQRIVVVGDLVADEFVYGDIRRVSREAPVLILRHTETQAVPGGAGNAAANLRALGAAPLPVGVVGRDAAGRRLLRALRAQRVDCSGVLASAAYATPAKSRVLAGGVHTRRQQIVRLDSGAEPGPAAPAVRRELSRRLACALRGAEGLLVADYGYGAAEPETVGPLLPGLVSRGIPVCVDSRSRVGAFPGATACTPNQEELEGAARRPGLDDPGVIQAARRLLRATRNAAVLVTRGARGMDLVPRGSAPARIPAFGTGEVADVTGAGDTVIAAFTLALVAGASALEAAHIANCAAGLAVGKAGTATVSRDELLAALEGGP